MNMSAYKQISLKEHGDGARWNILYITYRL